MTVKYVEQMVLKAMDDMDLVQRKNNVTVMYNSDDKTLRVTRFDTTVLVLDFDAYGSDGYKSNEVGVVMWLVTSKTDADALNTVFETLTSVGEHMPDLKFGYRTVNGGGYVQFSDGTEFE
jgi:hypothetical protein